jgi:8-oxo-dGTP pyrophosphatase MutT (NUDIX family)
VSVDRVRLPDGAELEHHVVRLSTAAVAVVVRQGGRVLAIRRHRFITDVEGWELPAGRLEAEESAEEGAIRECVEETGWRPRSPRLLLSGYPAPGLLDILHHVVVSDGADRVGDPTDTHEADRVEWLEEARLLDLIRGGQMPDGFAQYAVLSVLAGV